MISLLVILLFVLIALIFGIIFGLTGWRGGLFSGLRIFIFTLSSILTAYFIAPLISRLLYNSEKLDTLVLRITDAAADLGIRGLTFDRVLGTTLQRYMNMIIAPAVFLLMLTILSLTWLILKAVRKNKKGKVGTVEKKPLGLLLGITSAIFLTVFSIFIPKINLIKEARHVTYLYDIVLPILNGSIEYDTLLSDVPGIVDVYFETQIIAASEKERLDLLHKTLVHMTEQSDYDALQRISASLPYTDRTAFENELNGILQVIEAFGSDFINYMADSDIKEAVTNINDIDLAVSNMYALSMRDSIVQTILTLAIRDISGDKTYFYPDTIEIEGTQASFTELLEALPGLTGDSAEAIRNFNELKNSPLLPPEVFYQIIDLLRG